MKINMIKRELKNGSEFVPYSQNDVFQYVKLKLNTVYRCDIKQPRNLKHHSKYFALCRMVAENFDGNNTEEQVSYYLKKATGHIEVYTIGGETVERVKSINFDTMPQDEFEEYYNSCIPIVCNLLGVTEQDIKSNEIFYM